MNIAEKIAKSKMSGMQVRVVILAFVLIILDGYDVALASFTAPYVRKEFAATDSLLGLMLSGALIGMFIGSVFVAPLADRIGRRRTAIIGTALVSAGMFIGPIAQDMGTLFVSRIVTGLGIGAVVAVVGVILSEYTNSRRYAVVMAIYAAAINFGALLGALVIGPLLPTFGWRFAFLIGAFLGLLALVATWLAFPESISWLAEGRGRNALSRLNRLLAKMGQTPMETLPTPVSLDAKAKGSVRTIFARGMAWKTLLMIVSYLFYMIAFYFVANWAPTTVATGNSSPALAAPVTVAFSLGGLVGTVLFGFIAAKVNPKILTAVFLIAGAAGGVVFGISGTALPAAYVIIFAMSFFLSAGTAGFYSIIPLLYPTLARATGFGAVIGIGRLGGIAAPILGGIGFDAGLSMSVMFALFSVPAVISASCVVALHIGMKSQQRRVPAHEQDHAKVGT